MLVWMHAEPLDPHKIYLLKHTTRTVRARINQIRYRVDVNTLEHVSGHEARPERHRGRRREDRRCRCFSIPTRKTARLGSFIVIDPLTNATVGAGIIDGAIAGSGSHGHATERKRSTKEERIFRFGHPAAAVWVQGRPHVAEMVERQMFDEGWHVQMAGPNDFLAHELLTVAKAFPPLRNITIFSPLDDGSSEQQVVRAIFGPKLSSRSASRTIPTRSASRDIMKVLRKWRDAHIRRGEKKS